MIHNLCRNMQPFSIANKVGDYFGINGTAYEDQTRRISFTSIRREVYHVSTGK